MNITDEVVAWLEDYPEEDQKRALEDLQQGGCISGMVSPLVNYVDTLAFFERNKEEINGLLAEFDAEMGDSCLGQLFRFDKEDPLCLEQQNQNLLAWMAFEELANKVYIERYEN